MKAITPELFETIGHLGYDNGSVNFVNKIHLFTGRLSMVTYYSAFGTPAINISETAKKCPGIPDDTVIVGITHEGHGHGKKFTVSPDGMSVEGVIGHDSATFYVISLENLYSKGLTFFRVPGLALKFGINQAEVNSATISRICVDAAMPRENLVGKVIIPVVEEEDKGLSYYVNVMGETHKIPSMTTLESGLTVGVYDWMGGDGHRYLGTLKDHLFVDKESLKRDVVLYTNKDEAEKYRTADMYYASLDATAKAEAIDRERELNQMKSETTKLDNDAKVNTIKAKSDYEVSSLSRKDSLEETSFARSATLGVAALATAAIGVFAKIGLNLSMTDLVLASVSSTAVTASLLAGIFGNSILKETIVTTIRNIASTTSTVLSTTSGWVIGGVKAVVGTVGSIVKGVFGRLVGVF